MHLADSVRRRLPVVLLALVPVLFHLVIVETNRIPFISDSSFGALFKFGFVTVSALMHWGIYSSLLLTFALTLRPGNDPLITAMARKLHGLITPELEAYTRSVTIAWCCFFAAQLMTSMTLFMFAPLVDWSFFVNILDMPLILVMYAAEYMVRIRSLQNPPRHSLSVIMSIITEARNPRKRPECSF